MEGSFITTVMWHDSRGGECEAQVSVTYVGRHGFPQTLESPAEPATVEITQVETLVLGDIIPDDLCELDDLIEECFEHWRATAEAAEEARAEDRRERLREDAHG